MEPPTPVQLTAVIWCRLLQTLPLLERLRLRSTCKTLRAACHPWMPVVVSVPSHSTGGEEESSRATTNPGSYVQATLRDALSCYKVFRQKEPSRLFEIRLVSGVHETGMQVYRNSGSKRDYRGIISGNDIGGFNFEGSNWKHLVIGGIPRQTGL